MAASLQQEFCALRDTYIEKQFGRLNDMQRQADLPPTARCSFWPVQAAARPLFWSTASQT